MLASDGIGIYIHICLWRTARSPRPERGAELCEDRVRLWSHQHSNKTRELPLLKGGAGGAGGAGFDDGRALYPAQGAMWRVITQFDGSDPCPCMLGISAKPVLFATSKVDVFGCFEVISTKLTYNVISNL